MPSAAREEGFTLIELLVTMTVFAVVSLAFYQLLFSVARGTQTTQNVSRVAEEARLGFDRMVRDTREAQEVTATSTSPESFTVAVDFNADGIITPYPGANSAGDYEELTYEYDATAGKVRLNGELLMSDVQCVTGGSGCKPVFDYSSGDLDYDWNGDGITTWQELDDAPSHGVVGVGNGNGTLDAAELPFVSDVTIALKVVKGSSATSFSAQAQLRNNR